MQKPQPTNVEKTFGEDQVVVSKTDVKGRITYCNKLFIRLSGYRESELLGQPHNIVRHPDMPRVIFKILWEGIQAGGEVNAYVKNLAKDGSFYWVLANVTPSYDVKENIVGFYSVRRFPSKGALATVVPLYRDLLQAERRDGMAASQVKLNQLLQNEKVDYEEFILSL